MDTILFLLILIVISTMRRIFFPYIATVLILSAIFVACNSNPEPVSAIPPPESLLTDEPRKTVVPLDYADTTLPENQEIIRRLDAYLYRYHRSGFNGSVLVGQKGKVIYERYFGIANRETGLKLQPTSAVQLASVSKTFTGTAVLYLHEHKYLDINQNVKEYLPSFPYENITVKMLLNHRSGLPDYIKWTPRYLKDQKKPITNKQVLNMFAVHKPGLEFRPNARFKYSNSNYAILASVIEAVTETGYKEFMRRYVFEPLGMMHTFVYDPWRGLPADATISYKYNWVREPDMYADGVYGDKGIYSTARDLYRWDQALYNEEIISKETLEMAYSPYSFEKPGNKNYGLGWRMINNPDGNKIIYHNGWWHGNNTVFYRFINENFTIILLGNKYNNTVYRQAPVIYGLVKSIPVDRNFDSEE